MGTKLTNRERRRLGLLIPESRAKTFWPSPFRAAGKKRRLSVGRQIAAAVSLLAVAAFLAAERFPEFTGNLPAWTAAKTVTGRVTHVRDGDTIELSGIAIRFGSLNCAEQETLKGKQATNRMRMLVQGQRLTCTLNGRKSYDRYIGHCTLQDGRDLAAIMIRGGHCRRF